MCPNWFLPGDRRTVTLGQRLAAVVGDELALRSSEAVCKSCGGKGLVGFYEATSLPVQTTVLLGSKAEAEAYPVGDLVLGLCSECGLIQNTLYDADLVDYSKPTEESQAFSPKFQAFVRELADHLVSTYQLEGKSVLEVGSGKGEFLALLAERGIGHGIGLDPGFMPTRDIDHPNLEFIREEYDAARNHMTADLVVARHFMEHVPNVGDFFGWLAESVAATDGGALYVEVPDTSRILTEGAFWDVYYEHCSYFTLESIAGALARAGLRPTSLKLGYENQVLMTEAVVDPGPLTLLDVDLSRLEDDVVGFAGRAHEMVGSWRRRIGSHLENGEAVALWGGSSKAVAFLSTIGVGPVSVVDINPHKQGMWLPGVGVEVTSPEVLQDLRPALVIPMNPIYVEEIRADLRRLGLDPAIRPV